MSSQTSLPPPQPGELRRPTEWIAPASGAIRYLKSGVSGRCEDCLHLILDYLEHRVAGPPPGLALKAAYRRVQGTNDHLLCAGHARARQTEEKG